MLDALTENILNLNEKDQATLFRMLTDYAEVLIKIVPNSPLLAYIVSGAPEDNSAITQAYTAWKHTQ
jgi:hypothetical protein